MKKESNPPPPDGLKRPPPPPAPPGKRVSGHERVVSVRWSTTEIFKGDDKHKIILAIGRNMPPCVGSYEMGEFRFTSCEDVGSIYEGNIEWFIENFDSWAYWPEH